MSAVAVAVAQFAPSAHGNVERITSLVEEAAERGARLVVFPEYSSYFVDPFDDSLAAHAEELDGSFVRELTALAAAHKVTVVAGMVERAEDGKVFNTVVAVDETGLLARYRKQHLYDAFGQRESDWIQRGPLDAPQTFQLGDLTVGLITCYDLRFPESTRVLADAGVDCIVVPAEWVRGPLKEHHWRTLITARAIENTSYVVAADHTPPLGVGLSMIVDPQGVVQAGVGTAQGIAMAWIDRGAIEQVRRVNPALQLRRYRVVANESA